MIKIPFPIKLFIFGLFILIIASVATALAATNIVPSTRVTSQIFSVSANDLKPSACAGLNLTDIISGSGTITGTSGNDLILGGPGNDTINGMGGDDCILGGGGNDTIDGGDGTDVCIGGPGTDTFANCETAIQ
jgi:Ca2+-binding RTX toxin-like protein